MSNTIGKLNFRRYLKKLRNHVELGKLFGREYAIFTTGHWT